MLVDLQHGRLLRRKTLVKLATSLLDKHVLQICFAKSVVCECEQ